MLKNLKRASAIMLSLAMAVQFGLADTYYANTLSEEPIIEETQEQEPVTVEEGSQQVAVEQAEAPAIDVKEEFVQVPETKSVTLSYVAEDGTILQDATTHEYEIDYSLNSDASVMLNFDGYTLKDVVMNDSQIVAAAQANLNVTSDLTSVKFVYQKVMTESHPEANEAQEENKTEEKTEEDAEADPEAKEELPEYPAFDMSATAGNVTVHVTAAEGVLPSGAQLIVKRVTRKAILNAVEETVTEKDKEVDSAIALDITIVNADGIEIQPNGIVNVSFENVAVGGEEVNVYHVTDDASTVTEVATNTQSFDANHFSIYVITGEKKVELTTFNFVANEQNVSTQIVKTGDTLITPTAPDIAGKAFVEWQENGSKFDGFGVQTITKTETRTITAKYEDALYVYFYNPDGTQIMRTEKVADHNGHSYSHVSYDVDATHKLVGWAANQNGTDDITKNIAVPEGSTSVNVYAIIKEGYWVTFDSDGGSAIDSQFVFDKISLNDQTTPTKPGYTFDGWYNGSTKVVDGTQITKPMTLKAHWKATEVSYTVIHWWENADDDGYSFHESEHKTGLTGTEANATAKSYDGFTAQPVTKKTIKGDGSTIVSVYYKRNVYVVKFYSYSSWYTSSKEYTDLRITAKYGQDISKQWPTKNGSSTWSTKDNGSTYQANINTMPLGGTKFYGPQTGNSYCEAFYYVETLPGENSSITVGGIKYRLDHTDKMYGSGIRITKEDQYPLKGFTFNDKDSAKIGKKYDGASFYYTRNSYDLKFINNGKVDKSASKKYEQSISSENYTPTRPSSLPEYYVFDGWYENELCEGEAYDFTDKKMPAQNVTLYAKWTASDVKLTYNLNNPEGTVDKDTKKVEAGTVASTVLPGIPTINEYSFAGWYYADGNGNITSEVFNTNNTITRDTSIVGKWLYKGELRVVYNPGSETGATVPTDEKVYAGGARVTVAGNATTTSGKKFLGWELNGNVYKPGQSFEVNKDIANKDNQIILTATWGNAETSTTLTYDPGNGIGTVKTVNVMNNEAVEIKAHNSDVLAFTAPVAEGKEYYFAGWADSKTGNATYADGQTINVDANGENVLYAVWVEKARITVVAKSDEVTYDGNNHVVDGFNSLTIDGYTVSGLSTSVSGTDAGTYNNVITGKATVTKDGKDVTDRVAVTKQNGTLTINKRQVTLTSEGGSKPYDGTPLTKPNVTGGEGFVNGEVKDIKATGSVTNVSDGEVTNTITYTPSEKFNKNNYQITKNEGKLSITAVETEVQVQIVGATDTVGYDGHEHRVEGYTVTINNDKYHEADFTFSGNKVAKGINVGTYNMGLAAEQFKNNSSNFSNVTFTVTDGYLVITPKSINTEDQKITVSDPQGHVYDGNPHQEVLVVRDAELDKTLKSEKDYNVAYSTTDFTNVGEITITITGKGNYVGTVNKTYSITKRQVTLTSEGGSKPYDGTPLTRPNVTVGGDGFVTDEVTSVQAIGTVTEVKDSPVTNAIEYTVGTKFNINNYEISMTEGTLSITPKSINPDDQNMSVSDPQGHVYDGLEHKEELEVKDIFRDVILSAGTDYDVEYSTKDFTNVGKITITITGKGNYTGNFDRTYEITPATLTVTTPSANKVYDGTPLTAEGTISGFVNKETATFTTTGSQTEVGSSSNTYSIEWNGTAKSSNYQISKTVGTLTVTENENEIVVTTKHSSYTYDGLAHGTEVTVSDLPKGYSLEKAASSATATDVTTAIEATCDTLVIKNAEGKDVTNNLKITKVPGSITITPATLTVTTPSANKVYDGSPLKADGTISGFVNNETATFTTTGSQTEVGNSKNTYSIKWDGTAKSTNYQISEAVGTLTVTQQSIDPEDPDKPNPNYSGVTINNPSNKVYDGKEHKWSPAVADKEGNALDEGTDYEVAYSTEDFTNVTGTITVTITGIGNYTGKVTRTYEITPKAYTVTTDSAKKVYDGTALTAGGKIEGIVDGENVEFKVTGSQTNKGTSKNTYSLKWNGSAIETNYKLEKESIGDLTVTEQTIDPGKDPDKPNPNYSGVTINKPSNKVYDGKEHKWSPAVADKEGNALDEGTDYEVAYSTEDFTNVTGTITVTITGIGNYTGKVTRTYEITPKAYTVTTDSAKKVYDGTALTAGGKIEGIVDGENVEFKVTGSQTNKGTSKNTYSLKWNGSAIETNYKLEKESIGDLTVTEQTIDPGKDPDKPNPNYSGVTINKPSNKVYDGKEHKWSPAVADKEGNALDEGTDYEVAYSTEDFTNVTGTITVTITGIGNYTGKVTRTYEITPKAYTVTTDSAKKVYDGTALTAGGKIEGIVDGEVVVVHTTGSQTEVGSTPNTYKLEWKKASSKNYKLKEDSIGTLTVTEQTIDPGKDPDKPNPNYSGVTINNPSNKVYDGKEHKWSPAVADKEGNALDEGTDYEVAYSTEDFTNVTGTITVTITGIGNYTGKVTRTYEITPKAYTVTTDSAKKVYDGTALTAGGKIEGIVSGETVEFTTTGSRTDEGTSKNTYSLKWNGSAIQTNYKLAKESIGDLTVTPKSIISDEPDTSDDKKTGITVNDPKDSKYDGQEHREVLTVKDTKTGKDLIANKDYTVVYSDDLVNAGTVTIKVSGLGNYTGSFTKTYKITKRLVTLTSATVSKVYDGSALTNTSIAVSGDGFVEGEGASYEVTGTQTEVGNSANSFEYKLNENTLASNYNITKVVGTLTITAAPAPVTPATPSTPSSTTSTTPRTPSAPQVTTPVETVEKETTPKAEPKKEEKVEEEYTPKASPQYYWALINLICAIVTVLFGLLLLISKRHKSEDDEEDDDETKQQTNNDDESNEQEKKRGAFTRVLAVLIAILSVVFFLVTEDLSLRWTWTDQWTIWMVVIGFVQIVVFFVGRKWKNVDNDDEDEQTQQA